MYRVFSIIITQLIFKYTFRNLSESFFKLLPDRIACHVIRKLVFWRSVRGIGLEFVMIVGAYTSQGVKKNVIFATIVRLDRF